MTQIISEADAQAVEIAATLLMEGGVIAFPTETVYGLAAIASHPDAREKLFTLKQRDAEKPISLAAGTILNAVSGLEQNALLDKLAKAFWPGPLTMVAKSRNPNHVLAKNGWLGVRVPGHGFTQALLQNLGRKNLALTSANLSGKTELSSAKEISNQWQDQLSLIVEAQRPDSLVGPASTVVKVTKSGCDLLRQGSIAFDQIQKMM